MSPDEDRDPCDESKDVRYGGDGPTEDHLEFDLGKYEDERADTAQQALAALTKMAEANSPVRCDKHHFKPWFDDSEHAALFCESCGLIRVVERVVTSDGRLPVKDIPTPLFMPEDWPGLGTGMHSRENRIEAIRLLKLVRALDEGTDDEINDAYTTAIPKIRNYLEELDE